MTDEEILEILNENKYLNRADWHVLEKEQRNLFYFCSGSNWPYYYLDTFGAIAICQKFLAIEDCLSSMLKPDAVKLGLYDKDVFGKELESFERSAKSKSKEQLLERLVEESKFDCGFRHLVLTTLNRKV